MALDRASLVLHDHRHPIRHSEFPDRRVRLLSVREETCPFAYGRSRESFSEIVLAGFWLALGSAIAGVLWCCTIIGIPLGIACFNIAQASFAPLGKIVVKK